MKKCPKCNEVIQDSPSGRPRLYCSQPCRRLAEFGIRRLTQQLDALEEQRIQLEQPGIAAANLHDLYGRTHEQQLKDVQLGIETVENRLREMMGEETQHEQK